jgi:hypothetical protein
LGQLTRQRPFDRVGVAVQRRRSKPPGWLLVDPHLHPPHVVRKPAPPGGLHLPQAAAQHDRALRPSLRVVAEALGEQLMHVRRHIDVGQGSLKIGVVIERAAGQAPQRGRGETPHIPAGIGHALQIRRRVRAGEVLDERQLRDHLAADLADAEVGELRAAVLCDQDVRRFDITVHDITLMCMGQRVHQGKPPLVGEVVPAQVLLGRQHLQQILVEPRHHQVEGVLLLVLAEGTQRHDVRVIQPVEGIDLTAEERTLRLVRVASGDQLQSDAGSVGTVDRLDDLALTADALSIGVYDVPVRHKAQR